MAKVGNLVNGVGEWAGVIAEELVDPDEGAARYTHLAGDRELAALPKSLFF